MKKRRKPLRASSKQVAAEYVGKSQFDYLVEVESEATLRRIAPNFKQLATVPVRGIIVISFRESSDLMLRFRVPIPLPRRAASMKTR